MVSATLFAQSSVNSEVKLLPSNPTALIRFAEKPDPSNGEFKMPKTSAPGISQPSGSSATLKISGLRESEAIIGSTIYDLQTNRSISNRFLRNSDGTMSAIWTTLCEGGISSTDRGTGYNYYDGSAWLPADCHKIEPLNRAGFPNIAITSTGKEVVLAHSSTNLGMLLTSRPAKGTGAWTEDPTILGNFPDDTWSKMVAGGADGNSLHAIWNASGVSSNEYCGQLSPVVYSRSLDQGVTWPILRQCLALIDTPFYLGFSAEDYSIDTHGDSVAILVGDWTTDLVLLKSADNGDTWTKQIILEFYQPLYDELTMTIDTDADGTADIIPVPDGDGRVYFDNNGMIHVVFSEVFISDLDDASGVGYYPDADGGIWYWNESMGAGAPVLIAAAEDLNGDGILNYPVGSAAGDYYGSGTYGGGLSIQPTMGFDASNNMFVSYATYDETADTLLGAGHRHVYVIGSYDGGVSWSAPFDIVPTIAEGGDGEFQEAVFACMAKRVDGDIHIIYQRDQGPGHSLSNLPTEVEWNTAPSDIVYVAVTQGDLTSTGIISSVSFSVSQNLPNPVNGQTIFNVTLPKASQVGVRVIDVVGQDVFALKTSNYSSGQHAINLDCSKLTAGVYFYEVTAGNEKVTKKMIVE